MAKQITPADMIAMKVKINEEMSMMQEHITASITASIRKEMTAMVTASITASIRKEMTAMEERITATIRKDINAQIKALQHDKPEKSDRQESRVEETALMLAARKESSYAIELYRRETDAKIDGIMKGISQHIIPSIKETRQMIIENIVQDGMESISDYRQSVWKEFEGDLSSRAITDGSKPRSKNISPFVSKMFGEDDDDI